MIGLPVTHLLAAAAGGIVAASIAWSAQGLRYDARIADLRSAHAQAAQAAAEQAQTITTTHLQKAKDDAIQQAQGRAKANAAAAAAARRTSDGLRAQLASANARIASAAPAAVAEYATAIGAVFDDCRAAYAGMAEVADGHAADARLMREAWPVAPEK